MCNKILIILGLLSGGFLQLSAQEKLDQGFDLGLSGSFIADDALGVRMPNAAVAENGPLSVYQSNGGQLGLDIAYYFDERMGLSTGLNMGSRWIMSSVENSNSDRMGPYRSGGRMDFMEFPLNFVYRRAVNDNGLAVSARLGPTLTFWQGSEYGGAVSLGSPEPRDTNDSFRSSSTKVESRAPLFGLLLGVRMEKDFGNFGKIAYGASYHGQLTNGLHWNTNYITGKEKGASAGSFSSSFLSFDVAYYLPSGLFGD